MTTLDLMKADAEACNKRARRLWGVNNYVAGQDGIVRKQSERVMVRREKVWAMYEGGMTTGQIAEATGLTRSTVKSDICTARVQSEREAA